MLRHNCNKHLTKQTKFLIYKFPECVLESILKLLIHYCLPTTLIILNIAFFFVM